MIPKLFTISNLVKPSETDSEAITTIAIAVSSSVAINTAVVKASPVAVEASSIRLQKLLLQEEEGFLKYNMETRFLVRFPDLHGSRGT